MPATAAAVGFTPLTCFADALSCLVQEMEVGRDLACQRSFISEAERLHALRHAHLVPLYGVCLSGSKVGSAVPLWSKKPLYSHASVCLPFASYVVQ